MGILHHVSLGTNDIERALAFYDATLGALGLNRVVDFAPHAVGSGDARREFWVGAPHDQGTASAGNGIHVGFVAKTKDDVAAFYETALKHGGTDDGAPGPRPLYGPDYYGAFVRDPDGNKIEACLGH